MVKWLLGKDEDLGLDPEDSHKGQMWQWVPVTLALEADKD